MRDSETWVEFAETSHFSEDHSPPLHIKELFYFLLQVTIHFPHEKYNFKCQSQQDDAVKKKHVFVLIDTNYYFEFTIQYQVISLGHSTPGKDPQLNGILKEYQGLQFFKTNGNAEV